jgi:hypothetical protein
VSKAGDGSDVRFLLLPSRTTAFALPDSQQNAFAEALERIRADRLRNPSLEEPCRFPPAAKPDR